MRLARLPCSTAEGGLSRPLRVLDPDFTTIALCLPGKNPFDTPWCAQSKPGKLGRTQLASYFKRSIWDVRSTTLWLAFPEGHVHLHGAVPKVSWNRSKWRDSDHQPYSFLWTIFLVYVHVWYVCKIDRVRQSERERGEGHLGTHTWHMCELGRLEYKLKGQSLPPTSLRLLGTPSLPPISP